MSKYSKNVGGLVQWTNTLMWHSPGLGTCTCSSATLEEEFRNGVCTILAEGDGLPIGGLVYLWSSSSLGFWLISGT